MLEPTKMLQTRPLTLQMFVSFAAFTHITGQSSRTRLSQVMNSERFPAILCHFHVADNCQLKQGNEVAKIKTVYDVLNYNLKQFGAFHENLWLQDMGHGAVYKSTLVTKKLTQLRHLEEG